MHRIQRVRNSEDLGAVKDLFRAYAASLDIDLAYQNFEGEMAAMPGAYAPPRGEVLLARDAAGAPTGCIALRPFDYPAVCEMKRLYVVPGLRGSGLGAALVEKIVRAAMEIGYGAMVLDTLPTMTGALALYRNAGFETIPPYYDTPIAGTVFMRRSLGD